MTIAGLLAAAAAILFWPKGKPAPRPMPFEPVDVKPLPPRVPGFLEATAALAEVRKRLVATDELGEEEREAIDTLQLALTSGSDKP
jgi:hypothetical protein